MSISRRAFSGNALALAFASALFDASPLSPCRRRTRPVQRRRTTHTNSGMASSIA